jgi:hypothetical protein
MGKGGGRKKMNNYKGGAKPKMVRKRGKWGE